MNQQSEETPDRQNQRRRPTITDYYQQVSGVVSAFGLLVAVLVLIFSIMLLFRPDPALAILRGIEQSIATSESQSVLQDQCPTVMPGSARPCEDVEVTREVEVFVVVTATPPAQTATSQATVEPTPTSTSSVQLPYVEDFDSQLGPEWNVLKGIPILVDGELTAAQDDEVILQVGDPSWENYSVEIDFINLTDLGTVTLGFGQGTQYFATLNVEKWSSFESNEWIVIESCSGCGIGRNGRLRVETSGGQYSVYVDGQIHQQITFGSGISGPLSIRLTFRASLDNLLVSPSNR